MVLWKYLKAITETKKGEKHSLNPRKGGRSIRKTSSWLLHYRGIRRRGGEMHSDLQDSGIVAYLNI